MSTWDIDIGEVARIQELATPIAEDLAEHASDLGESLGTAIPNSGALAWDGDDGGPGLVGAALTAFVQHAADRLESVAERHGRSWQGAAGATSAYAAGDLDMAAAAQRAGTLGIDFDSTPFEKPGRR
ncbi:DUF6507 family protein [Streptomyces sp. JH002]|jgi:hypothetical protein|uniref:Uncharacterized protein n=1 Tax=Streptomyces xiamenensis TaxID=408015 RepID=A0A0F7FTC9_9ACTN|nr:MULTISPECIES: DUF6507 family protein [Streptomyces]AKG42959.1 hypothetical protein SXIM_15750 [Streptomyces xiamenensis]MCU4745598.1 DUF6507 family protein [Streptomyces sp. G-5]QQN79407.1 hypothetical protein IPZ77_19755 [Streptomyces sp. XC 2026]